MENFNEKELRLHLVKESNYDLTKAEKLYNFIIGTPPKSIDKPVVNDTKPDGIYFILSSGNGIHEYLATDEDKQNSVAIGVKMGNRFANVLLHDAAGGEVIALCQNEKVPCGSEQFFRYTFFEAMSDWDGEANTNDIGCALNLDINLGENEYIPSVPQLHLILLNINKINKALLEAGGTPMRRDLYWSSTENSGGGEWYVNFNNGSTYNITKTYPFRVRLSMVCEI